MYTIEPTLKPSKHDALTRRWFKVGPASQTVDHNHWFNILCFLKKRILSP